MGTGPKTRAAAIRVADVPVDKDAGIEISQASLDQPESGIAEMLSAAIERAPQFPPGTVVRFTVREGSSTYGSSIRYYTYAAVFVNDLWYTTGQSSDAVGVQRSMAPEAFLKMLGSPRVGDIRVATQWAAVR